MMIEKRTAKCACGCAMVQVVEQRFSAAGKPVHKGWTCSCKSPSVVEETVVFEPEVVTKEWP